MKRQLLFNHLFCSAPFCNNVCYFNINKVQSKGPVKCLWQKYFLIFGLFLATFQIARINSELVEHFTSHSLLSDNQYSFLFSRSTADVLTFITDIFSQDLVWRRSTKNLTLWFSISRKRLTCVDMLVFTFAGRIFFISSN